MTAQIWSPFTCLTSGLSSCALGKDSEGQVLAWQTPPQRPVFPRHGLHTLPYLATSGPSASSLPKTTGLSEACCDRKQWIRQWAVRMSLKPLSYHCLYQGNVLRCFPALLLFSLLPSCSSHHPCMCCEPHSQAQPTLTPDVVFPL